MEIQGIDFFFLLPNIGIYQGSALNIFPTQGFISVRCFLPWRPSIYQCGLLCENSYWALFVTFYVFLFSHLLVTVLSFRQYTERYEHLP